MLTLLNDTLQNYLISHKRIQIQAVAADKERAAFFNKILQSRNVTNSSQREVLSTIIEALDAAYKINKKDIEFELAAWYESTSYTESEIPASSSLLNSKAYVGFEHYN
jgi:hypothetical protein